MSAATEIETPRLLLRRFSASDAPLLLALDSDPEVMRYLSGGAPTPLEQVRDSVLPTFMRHNREATALGGWAVELNADHRFLGWVSLRKESQGEAELGYRFRRAAWGQGFATEAAGAVLDRAFATPGLQRVFATTYEDNVPSRRVMERLGMRFVRSFRYSPAMDRGTHAPGSETPWPGEDVEYEMLRPAWEKRFRAGQPPW